MSLLTDTLRPGPASLRIDAAKLKAVKQQQLRKKGSLGRLLGATFKYVGSPSTALQDAWNLWNVAEEQVDATRALSLDEQNRRQALYVRMKEALTFDEWRETADELDRLEGNNEWKKTRESPEYDFETVEAQLKILDDARISHDLNRMMYHIRTSLSRDLGGMGDLRLYKHSHIGTKDLIERYIDSARRTMETIVTVCEKHSANGGDIRCVVEEMVYARQAFGRSALLLSGGGTLGMNHIGVVKVLWEKNLLPRIISGASAGSIVCSVLCTRVDEEVPALLEDMLHGDLDVFEKLGTNEGFGAKIIRFMTDGALFDISHLIRVMKGLLGDMTFQEAYNRTRRILNISVSAAGVHELPSLLNYITAPNVVIWSAVAASCSVPIVFNSASLIAKDLVTGELVPWASDSQKWMDGSVDGDLPMTRLSEMFNVNHFIVSQVNPHVTPFLRREEQRVAEESLRSSDTEAARPDYLHNLTNLAHAEVVHRLHVLENVPQLKTLATKVRSVLSQKYSGDITILPEISYAAFPRILQNPDEEFMLEAMISGERATWPKLSRVQNHCAIELALDETIHELRKKLVFSPSQVDLRLNHLALKSIEPRGREPRPIYLRPTSADQSPRRPRSWIEQGGGEFLMTPAQHKTTSLSPVNLRKHSESSPPDIQIFAADMLSSSNDDEDQYHPNLFSEDGVDSGPDSLSSSDSIPDSSPQMRPEPDLWGPTARSSQLLPSHPHPSGARHTASRSQPTTPFYTSKLAQRLSNPALATPAAHTRRESGELKRNGRSDPALNAAGLGMTATTTSVPPPAPQSAAEKRYKQLFHKNSPVTSAQGPPRPETPLEASRSSAAPTSIPLPQPTPISLGTPILSPTSQRRSLMSKVKGLASGAGREASPMPPLDSGGKKQLLKKRKGNE